MPKKKSGKQLFDEMNQPGSATRELADWHRRDGSGPVPETVKRAVAAVRAVSSDVRDKAHLRIAKHRD